MGEMEGRSLDVPVGWQEVNIQLSAGPIETEFCVKQDVILHDITTRHC